MLRAGCWVGALLAGLVLAGPALATMELEVSPDDVFGLPSDTFTLSLSIDAAPPTEGLTIRIFFDPTQLVVDSAAVSSLMSLRPADDPGGRIFQFATVGDVTSGQPSPELTREIRYGASYVGNPGLGGPLLDVDFTIAPGASLGTTSIVSWASLALAGTVGDEVLPTVTTPVMVTPEPSTLALAVVGLAGLAVCARRERA